MSTPSRRTIVVAGSLAQKPGQGGHAWVFLQYLLGFRRLGFEVTFVDQLPAGAENRDAAVAWMGRVMHGFGLDGHWSLLDDAGRNVAGLSVAEVVVRTRRSAFLVNVMGFLRCEEVLAVAPRRVFLDIDPGFPQMWQALGLADVFAGHDDFVTIGENIGRPGCHVPTCDRAWITTPQPVVLEEWPSRSESGTALTSVATWRGAYGPVEYEGRSYGLRAHELRRFAALPGASSVPLNLALSIHPADEADRALLESSGWTLLDPAIVAADPWVYRDFIQGSAGELMVAKNMYVQARSGWISDRSICYLSTGRPVVAQDTGLASRYPTGCGLLTFTTFDEAVDAIEQVAAEPAKHGRAARELAEAYFDSDIVLGRLLSELDAA
jgi:hypothetical protein